jgi:hypothetical protein
MDTYEKDRITKPVAYKIELGLLPHWDKIFEKLAEQNEQKPEDFVKDIQNLMAGDQAASDTIQNPAVKDLDEAIYSSIGKREGLFGKEFWFDIYQDELSGMRLVWSHRLKHMLDRPVMSGHLFEPWPFLSCPKKYPYNYVSRHIELKPNGARFDDDHLSSVENDVFENGRVAYVPFDDIIQLLLELGKGFNAAGYAIKQFPEELKQRLEKNNIEYNNQPLSFLYGGISKGDVEFGRSEHDRNNEEWFKNRGVKLYKHDFEIGDAHVFHAPYYSVSINLKIFETGNNYSWMTE